MQAFRSQTANSVPPVVAGLGENYLLVEGLVEGAEKKGFTPKAEDIWSALLGAVLGETFEPLEFQVFRNNFERFEFTPPHLRTVFQVNDVTISVPPLNVLIHGEGAHPPSYKIELELGWVVQLRVAQTVLLEQSFSVGKTKITYVHSEKGLNVFAFGKVPAKTEQVQLQQQIQVPPGNSLEVYAIPYVRIVETEEEPNFRYLELHSPTEGLANNPSCTVLYEQQSP